MDSTTIMFVYQIPKDILKAEFPFIVEAIAEIPVTDWQQAPFFVWLFFRTIRNFLVQRNKKFRPPSWILVAILDFRAQK